MNARIQFMFLLFQAFAQFNYWTMRFFFHMKKQTKKRKSILEIKQIDYYLSLCYNTSKIESY